MKALLAAGAVLSALVLAAIPMHRSSGRAGLERGGTILGNLDIEGDAGVSGSLLVEGPLQSGDLTVNGDAGVTNHARVNGTLGVNGIAAFGSVVNAAGFDGGTFTATSTPWPGASQFSCSGAGTCGIRSTSGFDMDVDCGGAPCATYLGAFTATSVAVGRIGATVFMAGTYDLTDATLPTLISTGNILTTSTSTPTLGCTGAATCNFASASGQTADFDCGGGTCTARLGADATITDIGKDGGTTTIRGAATVVTSLALPSTMRGQIATNGNGDGSATVLDNSFCTCSGVNNPINVCRRSGPTLTVQNSAANDPVTFVCVL